MREDKITAMRRIVIVGCAGSGKSTLAQQLGAILKIEVVHLDALYWKPNWAKTPESEWQETVTALLEKELWILDGNFSSSRKVRFDAADTIIFLDFPRYLCLSRIIRRRFQFRSQDRLDRAKGCPEQLNSYLLKHIWSFPSRLRPTLIRDVSEYSVKRKVIVLRSPSQIRKFLTSLETGK
jgi:adenylate kinase family enzyme